MKFGAPKNIVFNESNESASMEDVCLALESIRLACSTAQPWQ